MTQPTDGGVAKYVERLARSQRDAGWTVSVACPEGELVIDLERLNIRRVPWEARRTPGFSVPAEVRALARIIDAESPDVVHLHSAKAGLAGRSIPRRASRIFQPHGWSWDAVGSGMGRIVRAWERYAASRCDLLVCVSEEERARGEEAGLTARWSVIENGVDLESFAPQDDLDRRKAKEHLGIPPVPLVVCVGPLRYQKGQDLLLRAWPLVLEQIPTAGLILVGGGAERAHLETLAGEGVVITGHTSIVATWIAAADVVAIPSRWDGLSLSLLEAMACARSVVATDTPGAARVLDGGGKVVPIGDLPALASALVARLDNPSLAATEGARGRKRIEEDFDWRRVVRQMDAAYRSVIAAQP